MKPWKVLSVQSRYELSVERQLASMGIEHYLPKLESVRNWSDRIKKYRSRHFPIIFLSETKNDTAMKCF